MGTLCSNLYTGSEKNNEIYSEVNMKNNMENTQPSMNSLETNRSDLKSGRPTFETPNNERLETKNFLSTEINNEDNLVCKSGANLASQFEPIPASETENTDKCSKVVGAELSNDKKIENNDNSEPSQPITELKNTKSNISKNTTESKAKVDSSENLPEVRKGRPLLDIPNIKTRQKSASVKIVINLSDEQVLSSTAAYFVQRKDNPSLTSKFDKSKIGSTGKIKFRDSVNQEEVEKVFKEKMDKSHDIDTVLDELTKDSGLIAKKEKH